MVGILALNRLTVGALHQWLSADLQAAILNQLNKNIQGHLSLAKDLA